MHAVLRLFQRLAWLVLVAGVLFQGFIKDRWDPGAIAFYAMPKPLLGLLAAALAIVSRRTQRWLAAAAGAALLTWWLGCSWFWNAPRTAATSQPGDLRLLCWNLSRPEGVHQGLVALVRDYQPHFVAGLEPGAGDPGLLASYEAALPGYQAMFMPRGILWLSRLPSRYRERGKLDGLGAYAVFEVDGPGPKFSAVVIDVYAHPLKSRRKQMSEALGHANGRADSIVLGDFNVPAESVHFAPFRSQLTDAFEAAGRGFRETWFWGIPLLSLDHVWAGRDWDVLAARKIQTRASDHAALLVTLRRRPGSSVAP